MAVDEAAVRWTQRGNMGKRKGPHRWGDCLWRAPPAPRRQCMKALALAISRLFAQGYCQGPAAPIPHYIEGYLVSRALVGIDVGR